MLKRKIAVRQLVGPYLRGNWNRLSDIVAHGEDSGSAIYALCDMLGDVKW